MKKLTVKRAVKNLVCLPFFLLCAVGLFAGMAAEFLADEMTDWISR